MSLVWACVGVRFLLSFLTFFLRLLGALRLRDGGNGMQGLSNDGSQNFPLYDSLDECSRVSDCLSSSEFKIFKTQTLNGVGQCRQIILSFFFFFFFFFTPLI